MGEASGTSRRLMAFVVSLVLVIVGFALIVYGFARKEAHIINWGLLDVGYTYFILATGGSIIFWSVYTVLGYRGPRGELDNIVKLGLWFAIVSLMVAGITILAELARPLDAALLILSGFNPASRIALDVPLITLFLVILAVHLILTIRASGGGFGKVEVALAILGFVVAIALYSNLAQVHGTITAVPAWYGPHLVAYFIVGAVLLGAAGQTLFIMPFAWRDEELKTFLARFYGQIIVLGVLLLAFLTAWNVITAWYNPSAWAAYSEI
ncbi:MAG: NrfD/PsrC family molybdoenzyme membrane anchor subunit, partial [Acidilobaceae archaeon]